jgi:hypothetical protein
VDRFVPRLAARLVPIRARANDQIAVVQEMPGLAFLFEGLVQLLVR